MPEQWYSTNDHKKYFMIIHKESDLHCPGIYLGLPDSQLKVLSIELTGKF
jgi:hypothetical protein